MTGSVSAHSTSAETLPDETVSGEALPGTAAPRPLAYATLTPGDPAPWFHQVCTGNPNYAFQSVGGRYIILSFFITAADDIGKAAVAAIEANRDMLDADNFYLFGVSVDPADETEGRIRAINPGVRQFSDYDARISRLYGALPRDPKAPLAPRRFWMVIDPTLRVLKMFPLVDADGRADAVFDYLRTLPPPGMFAGVELQAPVLYLPNVFEPELCRELIGLYETNGGEFSGFMREQNGITIGVRDPTYKSRSDYNLVEPDMIKRTQAAVVRRIVPEIRKIHQFTVTRMERYLVGCYTAEEGGHFRAHRDNTTAGTAHRRFAVSINLNDDFDGGTLSFPEYGQRQYKPPMGSAVVFSCSLLHAVSKVTRGRRYAFLPFLYDDAAAKIRAANLSKLSTDEPIDMRTLGTTEATDTTA